MPVHHVDVDEIGAATLDRRNVPSELGEVCRQD
jgi:hypothetical protein